MNSVDIEIDGVLTRVERGKLFPCFWSIDELEMVKDQNEPPNESPKRWMNCFIVFRRALGLSLKGYKLDGKLLTKIAKRIWRESSDAEKEEYKKISNELRERHMKRHPDFEYKAKRKLNELEYVHINTENFESLGKSKKKRRRNKKEGGSIKPNSPPSQCPVNTSENTDPGPLYESSPLMNPDQHFFTIGPSNSALGQSASIDVNFPGQNYIDISNGYYYWYNGYNEYVMLQMNMEEQTPFTNDQGEMCSAVTYDWE